MKIVVLDSYGMNPGDLSWDALKELGEVTIYDRTSEDEVYQRCSDADIVLTNKVVFDADTIWKLPNLKYIGVLATGYNIVDTVAACDNDIVVTNVPAYSTDSVAQLTFAHILSIANRVEHYAIENRNGRWSNNPDFVYWDTPLIELTGKTLGIVGLGLIGMKVAKMALCFGMDVFAVTSKHRKDLPEGIQKTTLFFFFFISVILSLHCPRKRETREMRNATTLAKMKHGAILINTGRGPLVNENDVAEALKSGQLGAYGTDVMCQEPPSADNPLFSAPNFYSTPHIAWATFEARQRLMKTVVDNVKAFIEGKPVNVVN